MSGFIFESRKIDIFKGKGFWGQRMKKFNCMFYSDKSVIYKNLKNFENRRKCEIKLLLSL